MITRIHLLSTAAILVVFCIVAATAAEDLKLLQEFALREHLGVSHAEQVVFFDLKTKADAEKCHLLDDAGNAVPFQFVGEGPHGGIAFCTDLPANATRTFKLMSGRGPQALAGSQACDRRSGLPMSMQTSKEKLRVSPQQYDWAV